MDNNKFKKDFLGINERRAFKEAIKKIEYHDLDFICTYHPQRSIIKKREYRIKIHEKLIEVLSDRSLLVRLLDKMFPMRASIVDYTYNLIREKPNFIEELIDLGLVDTEEFVLEALNNNYMPSQQFFINNKNVFLKRNIVDKLIELGFMPTADIIDENINIFSNEQTILNLINRGYTPSLSVIEKGDLFRWKTVLDLMLNSIKIDEELISKTYFIENVHIQQYILNNNPSLLLSLTPNTVIFNKLWYEAIHNNYIPNVLLTDEGYGIINNTNPVLFKKILKQKPEAILYSKIFYPHNVKDELDSFALSMGYVPTINDAENDPYVRSSYMIMESLIKRRPEAIRYLTNEYQIEGHYSPIYTMSDNNYSKLFQLAIDNGYIPTVEDIDTYKNLRESYQIMSILIKEKPALITKITDNTPNKEILFEIAIKNGFKGKLNRREVPLMLVISENYIRYELENNLITIDDFVKNIGTASYIPYRRNYSMDLYQFLISLNIEPKKLVPIFNENFDVAKLIVRAQPEAVTSDYFTFTPGQMDELLDIAINESNYTINYDKYYDSDCVSRSYKYAIERIKKDPSFINKINFNDYSGSKSVHLLEEFCRIAVEHGFVPEANEDTLSYHKYNYSYEMMKTVIPLNPKLLLICKIVDIDKIDELCQLAFEYKHIFDFEELEEKVLKDTILKNSFTFLKSYLVYHPSFILYSEIDNPDKLIQLYDIIANNSFFFGYLKNIDEIYKLFKNIDRDLWSKYLLQDQIDKLKEMVEEPAEYNPRKSRVIEFEREDITKNLTKDQFNILCCYENIQEKIIKLAKTDEFKFKIILDVVKMYSNNLEWIPILERVLNNIDSVQFYNILSSLENVNLTNEERHNLILLLMTDNDIDVMTYDDLKNIDLTRQKYISDLIQRNTVESLKTAYFEKVFSMSLAEAMRLVKTYGRSLDSDTINNIEEESKIDLLILNHIKTILNINSPEILHYYIDNVNPEIIISPELMITYEARLKYLFTREFNKSFLKPNEEDKISTENKNEEDLNIYLAAGKNGDKKFKMMITSLGAYSRLPEPDDYYASWNIQDLSSHGVCCSFVGNRNLGTARIKYCCLGFTDYEPGSLHSAGPYDLYSNSQKDSFDIASGAEPMYLFPDDLIDSTRHTHNEVVWERRSISGKEGFKKQPSYIVYFCDNFEDKDNDPDARKLWQSAVRASRDFASTVDGIKKPLPIIVVEREKIAKFQQEHIEENIKEFKETLDPKLVRVIVSGYESNYAGNREYHLDMSNKYFPQHSDLSESVAGRIIKIINCAYKTRPKEAMECCLELIRVLKNEQEMYFNYGKPSFNIGEALFQVEEIVSKLKDNRESSLSVIGRSSDNNRQFYSSDSHKLDSSLSASQLSSDDVLKIIEESATADLITKTEDEIDEERINEKLKVHGKRHIKNVLLYSTIIAQDILKDKHDVELIAMAAKYHDVGRKTDAHENHAEEGSNIVVEKLKNILSADDIAIVQTIIEFHETPRNTPNIDEYFIKMARENGLSDELIPKVKVMAEILRDADALDRTRFINKARLDTRYLKFDISKRLVKLSASVQETYAIDDLLKYECDDDIFILLQFFTPQEVLRNIRHSTKGLNDIEDVQSFIHSWAITVSKNNSFTQEESRRSANGAA